MGMRMAGIRVVCRQFPHRYSWLIPEVAGFPGTGVLAWGSGFLWGFLGKASGFRLRLFLLIQLLILLLSVHFASKHGCCAFR